MAFSDHFRARSRLRKERVRFLPHEVRALQRGVQKHGKRWVLILREVSPPLFFAPLVYVPLLHIPLCAASTDDIIFEEPRHVSQH